MENCGHDVENSRKVAIIFSQDNHVIPEKQVKYMIKVKDMKIKNLI